jgi:hypothetical protein
VSSATKHLHNCKTIIPQLITNLQVQKASIGMTAETSHNSSLTFEFSKQASKHLPDCRIIPQFITDLVKVEKKHGDRANK